MDRRPPTPDLTADPTKDPSGVGAGQCKSRTAACSFVRLAPEPLDAPAHADANTQAIFEPRLSVAATAACMIEVRKILGPEVVLMLELHHRFSVAEAASLAQKLPAGTVDMLEEPIRDESPEAYETLRKLTDIPFAVGEEFASKWQFLPFIEKGLHQYCRVDLGNVGGFTETMKVAGWCEAHYIDLMPHNPLGPISTAANIQLGAAVPNYVSAHAPRWGQCAASLTGASLVSAVGLAGGPLAPGGLRFHELAGGRRRARVPLRARRAPDDAGLPAPDGTGARRGD